MTYLSIIEKFKILFQSLIDFKFILVFAILLILLSLLYGIKKLSTKKYALFMIILFIMVFCVSIINNHKILSNTFDNFITLFFGNIYFPSIYVYIGILVISFISFITSLLNKMIYKVYKVINTIMFVVNNFLFVIILNIIAKNKIDIFSVNSLYTNTSLVAILELSVGLFILWVLALITTYITNVISDRLTCKKIDSYKNYALQIEVFKPLLEANLNLDNLYENVNVDRKIPLLIEKVSNNEEFMDSKVIIEEKNIAIETVNDDNEDIILEGITEDVFEVVNIEENDIIDEGVIIQNNAQDDNVDDVVIETINDADEDVIVESITEEVFEVVNIEENDIIDEGVIIQNNAQDDNVDDVVIETINDADEDVTTVNTGLTINDILNGCIPVNYYENDIVIDEYTLSDPQKMYEDNYNKVKCESFFDDVLITDMIEKNRTDIFDEYTLSQEENKDNVLSLDNLTNEENVNEERLYSNTVSLNDLIDDEEIDIYGMNNVDIDNINDYTVDDYKKMCEMLNDVRMHANNSNINIDDAVAISLIRNYSIDDCLKFKNILENNLN